MPDTFLASASITAVSRFVFVFVATVEDLRQDDVQSVALLLSQLDDIVTQLVRQAASAA
jgi:hypothetical protein